MQCGLCIDTVCSLPINSYLPSQAISYNQLPIQLQLVEFQLNILLTIPYTQGLNSDDKMNIWSSMASSGSKQINVSNLPEAMQNTTSVMSDRWTKANKQTGWGGLQRPAGRQNCLIWKWKWMGPCHLLPSASHKYNIIAFIFYSLIFLVAFARMYLLLKFSI